MIAKKKVLKINELENFSLQASLQTCQLSPLTRMQVQAVSFAICKEKATDNQPIAKFSFASLFAQNSN